ncbi:MAG: porin family protein [Alphaproteobacteria bacterium]|nr:porin family protein [Alphaproteobacteria bacterium]
MKRIFFIILSVLITFPLYATTSDFHPYIGIDAGMNITDYTTDINMDDTFYSATINAGARIGNNFGAELFFSHSSSNDMEYLYLYDTLHHELYYMAFGFDIYAYYNISREFDLFTSFGVANYKVYNKYDYLDPYSSYSETQSDSNVTTRLGIGIMYTIHNDNVSLLAQYQYVPINNEIINTMSEFSIGARYLF